MTSHDGDRALVHAAHLGRETRQRSVQDVLLRACRRERHTAVVSKKPPRRDLLHRRAQVAVLAGLLRGDDIDALVEAVAPSHVRGWFTPDVASHSRAAA